MQVSRNERNDLERPCKQQVYYDGVLKTCVHCSQVCVTEYKEFCRQNCPGQLPYLYIAFGLQKSYFKVSKYIIRYYGFIVTLLLVFVVISRPFIYISRLL